MMTLRPIVELEAHGSQVEFWREPDFGGACFARARYQQPHEFVRHIHDELVIAVTESGSGRCETPCGIDTGGPDTVWIFEPGSYHNGHVTDDGHWFYRGIYLDEQALAALAAVCENSRGDAVVPPPGLYHDRQLARMLVAAQDAMRDGLPMLDRQILWWSAMGFLLGRYGDARSWRKPTARHGKGLAAAKDYLVENYTSDVSVDELADIALLSRFHFIRAFRREFGLPPHAYVNQLRLIAAKRLLANGEALSEVATTVGFYDQSHLTRLFKKAYGITPGVYAAASA